MSVTVVVTSDAFFVSLLIFIGVFMLVNCNYFIKNILISKNILARNSDFNAKKLNIIFLIVALVVGLFIAGIEVFTFSYAEGAFVQELQCSLFNAFSYFFVTLAICQVLYCIVRLILQARCGCDKLQ